MPRILDLLVIFTISASALTLVLLGLLLPFGLSKHMYL